MTIITLMVTPDAAWAAAGCRGMTIVAIILISIAGVPLLVVETAFAVTIAIAITPPVLRLNVDVAGAAVGGMTKVAIALFATAGAPASPDPAVTALIPPSVAGRPC
jgi:hypothetical protein